MSRDVEHWTVAKQAVVSEAGVVAAQHVLAARAGAGADADMLAKGGQCGRRRHRLLALGAVEPWMCGLGGSGYMVVWLAAEKRACVFDFQGMLPVAISGGDYPLDPNQPMSIMGFPGVVDRQNEIGYRSITVPGAVKGLAQSQEKNRAGDRGWRMHQ